VALVVVLLIKVVQLRVVAHRGREIMVAKMQVMNQAVVVVLLPLVALPLPLFQAVMVVVVQIHQ
jgi:protein-S-isoprenylcysteine O-methyltransferase Ste14